MSEDRFAQRGINVQHPLEKKGVSIWQAELFVQASSLFALVIPEFVLKQYVLHFSKMSLSSHVVKMHRDVYDVSHQYSVHIGNWDA